MKKNVHYTTCPYNCWPINCGLQVCVYDGNRIEISGNQHHDFSRGRLCVKGQSCFEIVHNKERLKTPLKRDTRNGQFREISWDAGIARWPAPMAPLSG